MTRAQLACVLVLVSGCAGMDQAPRDTGLDGLALTRIDPALVLPGTKLVLSGVSFVDDDLGATSLRFEGRLREDDARLSVPARYVSSERLEVLVDAALVGKLGGRIDGALKGEFTVEVTSSVDGALHRSDPLPLILPLATESTPSVTSIADGKIFVNQPIEVTGAGFLLGEGEGSTFARVNGCFTPAGKTVCNSPTELEIPTVPAAAFDREHARFVYTTDLSGIGPGHFAGTVVLVNRPASGPARETSPVAVGFDIQRPAITGSSTTAASLGQYVLIEGGGFVGGTDRTDESTVIQLTGEIVDDAGKKSPVAVVLVPEFVSGLRLRYVLDEKDALGALIDLRTASGTITGSARVTVQKGATKLDGDLVPVTLRVLPVKQVVYIEFLHSYVSSLRLYGLRAADALIRKRVFEVNRRIYQTLNVEFIDAPSTDFALYAVVDVAGPDPNNEGLFGYDNTPGKDVGNVRLYDRIGGVNATTQADNYAGFGGVFTEAFFAFSDHPRDLARSTAPDALFDELFDPFRPDGDGTELTAAELAALAPEELTDGAGCPAATTDRRGQVSCAVWGLGNLIGSSLAHELGHSFGLAEPYGSPTTFHNFGDLPNRLMETGDGRPLAERVLIGEGPAEFCIDEYEYMRDILRSDAPATDYARPPCD